jgi:hypothetical protein
MLRSTLILWGLVCCSAFCSADEKKVPLETTLPKEVLAGTPPNMLVKLFPNLQMPPDKAPELLVPEGTKNVALKKKITSSETEPILGDLKFVTDGVKDGTEEAYVELSPGKQWVQIDLEKPTKIFAIYLWHYFREARSYQDVIIQVADDAEFTKNVQTIYNNDTDASSKLGVGKDRPYIETNRGWLVDAKGITGRYVRLYSKGNTANSMNHYVEVEVFGTTAS